jgi:hypothetical protein
LLTYLRYYLRLSIGRQILSILHGSLWFGLVFSRLWFLSLDIILSSSGLTPLLVLFISMVTMMMFIAQFAFIWLTSLVMSVVRMRFMRRTGSRIFFPCYRRQRKQFFEMILLRIYNVLERLTSNKKLLAVLIQLELVEII